MQFKCLNAPEIRLSLAVNAGLYISVGARLVVAEEIITHSSASKDTFKELYSQTYFRGLRRYVIHKQNFAYGICATYGSIVTQ